MTKLIMTKGLPASGKSTWAKEHVLNSDGKTKRINKDDLRAMFDAGRWSQANEQNIINVRNSLVEYFLVVGYDVIVDDTNLHPKHEEALRKIANDMKVHFEIKDFTNVPLHVCLERDRKRTVGQVGDKVIINMWNQFLKPPILIPDKTGLSYCIIVDIDGTLALFEGKNPYKRDFMADTVNYPVWFMLDRFCESYRKEDNGFVMLFSGRSADYEVSTRQWLLKNNIPFDKLFMRKSGDTRPDEIVKKEMFHEHIANKYNPLFVIDDRIKVCRMWYDLGLFVFNVNQGLVDF